MKSNPITSGWTTAKRRMALSVLAACAFFALGTGMLNAQPGKPSSEQAQVVINQIDVSQFPSVKLFVSVLDSSGKMVRGLGEKDFLVREDEVEQSPVQVATQLPSIASTLVMDTSGSMKRAIGDAQRAATTYADNVRAEDEVLIIDFSDKVKVVQSFTSSKPPLRAAIGAMKARGNTALYDAVFEAVRSFGDKKGRKVAIVLTDGRDDDGTGKVLSVKTVEQVIAAAREVNVPVFTIGLGTDVDEAILTKIAVESGGRYFPSPSPADLENLYREIGAQLTGQYLLSYDTDLSERDGSWHRVVVRTAGGLGQKPYMAPLDPAAVKARDESGESPARVETPPEPPAAKAAEAEVKPSVNVLAAAQGTRVMTVTSQYDSSQWAAANLIDEAIGKGHGYAATDNRPQEVVLELPKTALISEIIVDPFTDEGEDNWVKDMELWVSNVDSHTGYSKVLGVQVDNKRIESQDPAYSLTEQSFPLPSPARVRWVKLMLKSNHGGSFMEAGEMKLMGHFLEEEASAEKLRNVLSEESGGKLLYFSSQYNDGEWAARNLVDGKLGKNHGYASRDNAQAEVVFVLSKPTSITQLAFNPFTTEDAPNWVKDVEVQVSTEGPKAGYKSVGKFELHNRQNVDRTKPLPDQVFKIEPVQAKFIKLILLKNHGGGYMELGEFKALAPEK